MKMRCWTSCLPYVAVGALVGFLLPLYDFTMKPKVEDKFTTIRKTPREGFDFGDARLHLDNRVVADDLGERVRVFCLVITTRYNLNKKARHVRDTWSLRCTKTLFVSSRTDYKFPAVGVNISDSPLDTTQKTIAALRYVYENHVNDADWFVKSDEDTYVILENLRYFLSDKNPDEPVFYGHHSRTCYIRDAGYVLSKTALGKLYQHASRCNQAVGVDLSACFEQSGIKAGVTSDVLGRSRFHCLDPASHSFGESSKDRSNLDLHDGYETGLSDYAILFHEVEPRDMYGLEYLVYHLRPYGLKQHPQPLN